MSAGADLRLFSARLLLRPVPADAVRALVSGTRLADWAEDYPTPGDLFIAGGIDRGDGPVPAGDGVGVFGHYQVTERDGARVVGGIGFRGPPQDGEAELGYGIVPSCRNRGYATEVLVALCAAALLTGDLCSVVATTEPDNLASKRVLVKAGFSLVDQAPDGGLHCYRLDRPR